MKIRSYIDGKWVLPRSERTVRTVNPAHTDEVVWKFPSAGEGEAHSAIDAARRGFVRWREVPAPERGRYISKVAEHARDREAQLPFGGCRATGHGDREMADEGLNFSRRPRRCSSIIQAEARGR